MEKKEPLVSIIILNYNFGRLLINCVESVYKTDYANYEIILVDNASTDKSHKLCKEKFPDIILIENEKNLGYCAGNNIGIRKANGEFLVILNPDVIVNENWLKEFFYAYQKNGDALYQPKLVTLDDDSRINSAGNMIQTFGFGFSMGKGEKDSDLYNEPRQIGFASGACLFISKNLMEKIGYFEPFLFSYNDDMDFGWRALKMGRKSCYVPSVVIKHSENSTKKLNPKKFYFLERNRHYCILTHYSKKSFMKLLPSLIIIEVIVLLFFLSKGLIRQKLRGYKNIIANWKYISKKHDESESIREISDKEILENFVDEIFVPDIVSGKLSAKIFNKILRSLSKSFRYFV